MAFRKRLAAGVAAAAAAGSEDTASIARLVAELDRMPPGTQVPKEYVLDLLNPRGMWRHIHTPTEPMEKADLPELVGDEDPMTGCRPVAAHPD